MLLLLSRLEKGHGFLVFVLTAPDLTLYVLSQFQFSNLNDTANSYEKVRCLCNTKYTVSFYQLAAVSSPFFPALKS